MLKAGPGLTHQMRRMSNLRGRGGGGGQWGGDLAILTSFSLGWVRQAADGPGLEDEAES